MAPVRNNVLLTLDDGTRIRLSNVRTLRADPTDPKCAYFDGFKADLGVTFASVRADISDGMAIAGGGGGGSTPPPSASSTQAGVLALAGDLGGTSASPKVEKINGVSVGGTAAANKVLTATSASAAEWKDATAPSTMVGATASLAGTAGSVPAPAVGKQADFLRGDGTWTQPAGASTMTGATAAADGAGGLVPKPVAGKNTAYLRGDGTWTDIPGVGAATTSADGTVRLADAAAITAGTAGRVVDAEQLQDEITTAVSAHTGDTDDAHDASAISTAVITGVASGVASNVQTVLAELAGRSVADATTSATGVVRLADAAAVTAGTAGRIPDAAQMLAQTDLVRAAVTLLAGVPLADGDLGTFAGSTIANDSTIKAALQALETALEAQNITGRYIGSATTYATLPTTSAATGAAINGDWTYLRTPTVGTGTAQAPQYPKGVYIFNGTAYSFAFDTAVNAGDGTNAEIADGTITDARNWSPQVLHDAVSGRNIGSAATYATLPTTTTLRDMASLTADVVGTGTVDNPQYPAGWYVWNGTAWTLALPAPRPAGTLAELEAGTVQGSRRWTPETIHDGDVSLDNKRWRHFASGSLNLRTMHNGNNGEPYRIVSFGPTATLTNAPGGAATNVTGFAQYNGDENNGFVYVTLLQDPLRRYVEAYATVTAGVYSAWTITSGTEWIPSASGDQLSSGIRMIVGDGHALTISAPAANSSSDIRLVPATSWAAVGAITAASGSTITGTMPTIGTEEVVLVPSGTGWLVSRTAAQAALPAVPVWTPNTAYVVGQACHANIGGVIVTFMVITAHTSPALFDVSAMLNLRYVGQHRVTGSFPAGTAVPQGFKVRLLNVQWERGANGLTGASFDAAEMAAWVSQGNSGWRGLVGNSRVEATDGRVYTTGSQTFFLRSNGTRNTGATIDAAELANWQLVGQSSRIAFVADQVYPPNAQVIMNGSIWERINAGGETAWTPANWTRLTAGSAILWSGNVIVQPDEKRFIFIGGPRCEFESTSAVQRITAGLFDATEAANWRLMRQSFVPDYPASAGVGIMFPAGYQVTFNGALYERIANGQGNAFNAAEWHALTASSTVSAWAAGEAVRAGDVRTTNILGAIVQIRSNSARTTTATFDAVEAGNWSYLSQSFTPPYNAASTTYLAGFRMLYNAQSYERNTTSTSTTFTAPLWTKLSTDALLQWSPNEALRNGDLRTWSILGATITMRVGSNRTTNATFDAAEAGNWTLITQGSVPGYVASAATFVAGFRVLQAGQTWQRNTADNVSTFVPSEWTQLSSPGTGATVGDAKSGFQTADHNGWILLNGRAKSTLSTSQQAAATGLGIGANLPDATGRSFTQGTLLAQIGSTAIAQNQLPNVTVPYQDAFTSAIFTAGTAGNTGTTSVPRSGASNGALIGWTGNGQVALTNTLSSQNTSSINGNVTQQAFVPASIGVNQFIYLGL